MKLLNILYGNSQVQWKKNFSFRRKSRSTRSSNRSGTKRRLRALAEIPDYNDYSEDDPDDLELDPSYARDDDADFLPAGRGRGGRSLVRRRFLPKGKRTFFKGMCCSYLS